MADPLQILWYMNPTDGPFPWKPDGAWPPAPAHMANLARTIDQAGFYGALIVGRSPFIEVSSFIPITETMRFLIPIYPGSYAPAMLVQQAQTFDELSGGRLIFNQVNGTDAILPQYDITVPSDERYRLSAEYWRAFKALYAGRIASHDGDYFRFGPPPPPRSPAAAAAIVAAPHTPVWGSGASPGGIRHAGEVLDTYLTYIHRPDRLGEQVAAARAVAASHGRTLRAGTLANIIVRETEEEAWAHAQWVLEQTGAEHIIRQIENRLKLGRFNKALGSRDNPTFANLTSDDPAIRRRLDKLRAGELPDVRDLESSPNIWSGPNSWGALDVLDQGWGGYLVGSAENVAARIRELQASLGIDAFILAGWPLAGEARRVSELLLPLLDLDTAPPALGPLRYPSEPTRLAQAS